MHKSIYEIWALLQCLQEKGLWCKLEKCCFAESSIEYLRHTLSREGILKGSMVDAVLKMPPPTDVASLRLFLGAVQFQSKFIHYLSTMTETLTHHTRKGMSWRWTTEEQANFKNLKDASKGVRTQFCLITTSTMKLAFHVTPLTLVLGLCRYIAIKTVVSDQFPMFRKRLYLHNAGTVNYKRKSWQWSFGLKKFHHFLYGRHFILVIDHKPLVEIFGPTSGKPAIAANRLARWALMLSQYDYEVEHRATKDHGNVDILSQWRWWFRLGGRTVWR